MLYHFEGLKITLVVPKSRQKWWLKKICKKNLLEKRVFLVFSQNNFLTKIGKDLFTFVFGKNCFWEKTIFFSHTKAKKPHFFWRKNFFFFPKQPWILCKKFPKKLSPIRAPVHCFSNKKQTCPWGGVLYVTLY